MSTRSVAGKRVIRAADAGLVVGKTYTLGLVELADNGWAVRPAFTGTVVAEPGDGVRNYKIVVETKTGARERFVSKYANVYRVEEIIL